MDTLIGIYEVASTNDWSVAGIKLVLIAVLFVAINKCLDIVIEGMKTITEEN